MDASREHVYVAEVDSRVLHELFPPLLDRQRINAENKRSLLDGHRCHDA